MLESTNRQNDSVADEYPVRSSGVLSVIVQELSQLSECRTRFDAALPGRVDSRCACDVEILQSPSPVSVHLERSDSNPSEKAVTVDAGVAGGGGGAAGVYVTSIDQLLSTPAKPLT